MFVSKKEFEALNRRVEELSERFRETNSELYMEDLISGKTFGTSAKQFPIVKRFRRLLAYLGIEYVEELTTGGYVKKPRRKAAAKQEKK